MIHYPVSYGHNYHYSVSSNEEYILVQVQDEIGNTVEQARVPLTVEEAQHMVALLNLHINKVIQNKSLTTA